MGTYNFGKMGGDVVPVEFEGEELPLETVLKQNEVGDDFDVTVNGQEPVEDQMVKSGDIVLLVPEVSGG